MDLTTRTSISRYNSQITARKKNKVLRYKMMISAEEDIKITKMHVNHNILAAKVQDLSIYNVATLANIDKRKDDEIITGYEYLLQCNLPSRCQNGELYNSKQPWNLKTDTKKEKVIDRLNSWRYEGEPIKPDVHFVGLTSLSLNTYDDVARLSQEFQVIGDKICSNIDDVFDASLALHSLLRNLEILKGCIKQLYLLTSTLEYLDVKDAKVKRSMDKIMEGFDELSEMMGDIPL